MSSGGRAAADKADALLEACLSTVAPSARVAAAQALAALVARSDAAARVSLGVWGNAAARLATAAARAAAMGEEELADALSALVGALSRPAEDATKPAVRVFRLPGVREPLRVTELRVASHEAATTGTSLWAASLLLAGVLATTYRRLLEDGASVLELGCGVALPSLAGEARQVESQVRMRRAIHRQCGSKHGLSDEKHCPEAESLHISGFCSTALPPLMGFVQC